MSRQLSLFDSFEPEETPVMKAPLQEEQPTLQAPQEEYEPQEVQELHDIQELQVPQEPPVLPEIQNPQEPIGPIVPLDPQASQETPEVDSVQEIPEDLDFPAVSNPLTPTAKLFQPMVISFEPEKVSTPEETPEVPEILPTTPVAAPPVEPEILLDPVPTPVYESEPVISVATPRPVHKTVNRKILITGASGFIGGFLVREALDRGYEVWAGIRAGSSRARLRDERIRFIDLAYSNELRLRKQLEEFRQEYGPWDFVIHNAGITKTIDKTEFSRVNAGYTHALIEALHAADCQPQKFLLMSSLSSYGRGDEKGFTPIRLEDKQRPDTAYGQSKLEAENFLRAQDYFPYIILRPTGVYGPGDPDYFMEIKSIRSGFDFTVGLTPQRITFIYVKDLARVAFLALEKEEVKNKAYFVADGDVYTDHSFARIIQEILSKKRVFRARIPSALVYVACLASETIGKLSRKSMTLNTDKYKILKQRNWICDVAPLQEDLNFIAEYPLREGLEEAIIWYIDEGWL